MIVLGLNHGEINSSACLVKDGQVICGAPEERFNRQKKTRAYPKQAIDFCLEFEGIELRDVDAVAQAWNPGAAWIKFNPLISGVRVRREDYFYSLPDNLMNNAGRQPVDWVRMEMDENAGLPPVYYLQHHRSHAANAFFLSPFEEAAVLTCDWRGEFECTTFSYGKCCEIELLQSQQIPHSLGMFYATFTELLGYRPDNDEWRVMALSAFDIECEEMTEKIRGTIRLREGGYLELDESYYKGAILDQPKLYTEKLVALLGGREGVPQAEPDDWYLAVSRAMQTVSEEIAYHFLENLHERTGCPNVVLGGGYFMNSVLNGKVLDRSPFEKMYVSYAPGDVGNSLGAALYVSHCLKGVPRTDQVNRSSYIGPRFDSQQIRSALARRSIPFSQESDIEGAIAVLLAQGEVVAVFNGAMEFGERALGNRSILGDPRNPETKDHINASVKFRESYRPFAPAVLAERAPDYFDMPAGLGIPYMEGVVPVKEQFRTSLPAITHVDGSGRVQTVERSENPFFHGVISKFEEKTGYPIVLNTSFNINGEPMVLSPDDALTTFFNSGLKNLALGEFLIQKKS